MATLYKVPTQNSLQFTLDQQLAQGGTSLTLNQSVAGIVQSPGVCVIDRVDSSGNRTSSAREYVSFTGVSGAQLTGLTRGLAGSSDQVHSVGAIVEFVPDVVQEQAKYDVFITQHDASGAHTAIIASSATVSFANAKQLFVASQASIYSLNSNVLTADQLTLNNLLIPSAASIWQANIQELNVGWRMRAGGVTTDLDLSMAAKGTGKLVRDSAVNDTIFDNGNSGVSLAINWANGSTQKLTLTGNCTLSYLNVKTGDYMNLILVQDATGSRTVAWPPGSKHPNTTAVTLTTTANAIDYVGIRAYGASEWHNVASSLKLS